MNFDEYYENREPFIFEGKQYQLAVMTLEVYDKVQEMAKLEEGAENLTGKDVFDHLSNGVAMMFVDPATFRTEVISSPKIGLGELRMIFQWAQEQVLGGLQTDEAPLSPGA